MTAGIASREHGAITARTNDINWRGVAFDLVALAIAMAVGYAVWRAPIGSGDYGQWLMVSRVFSGEDVPSYRNLSSVAPLVPLILALIRVPIEDPMLALNVLRVLLVVSLVFAFYLAGASIFASRAAGLWSAIFPAILTDQFLEMFAFGGLLQAAGIIFMLLSIAAVAEAGRRGRHGGGWWTAAASALALAIASHAGSVVVIVPVVGVAAVLALLANDGRREWRTWPRLLAPAATIAFLAMAYWLVVLVPANREYANNPASLAYRGPDRLFEGLTDHLPGVVLLLTGAVAIGWGLGRSIARRRLGAFVVVAAWAAVTWLFVVATIVAGAATDYPRFAPLMLAPIAVATGGLAGEMSSAAGRVLRAWQPDLAWFDPTFAFVGLLMVGMGARELDAFRTHANGYALNDVESLTTIAAWVDAHVEDDQFVLVSSGREAKWIEGLSGESTLFSSPVRYDFRPSGWPRSIAAEALLRSTTSIVDGAWFAMYTNSASTGRADVPRELLLGMNHGGEYLDLLRVPDAEARVLTPDAGGGVLATLGALEPVDTRRYESGDAAGVVTEWSGMRRGSDVGWTREVSLLDQDRLRVVDEVRSGVAIAGLQVKLTEVGSRRIASVEVDGTSAILRFTEAGNKQPAMRLAAAGADVQLAEVPGGLLVTGLGSRRLELELTPLTNGAAIAERSVLYPPQLAEDYAVGAVVLTHSPATEARLRRLEALGYRVELDIGSYLLLVPEYAAGR